MKENWIVTVSGSEMERSFSERVCGTKEQVKRYLLSLVAGDKKFVESEGYERWKGGAADVSDITEEDGSLITFGRWGNVQHSYTATLEMEPVLLA